MLDTVSITDLKQNTAKVVNKVKSTGEPVVVIQRSEPAAVLVEPDYYEMLEQALEDIEDIRDIEARKNEPVIPAQKVAKKLGLEWK